MFAGSETLCLAHNSLKIFYTQQTFQNYAIDILSDAEFFGTLILSPYYFLHFRTHYVFFTLRALLPTAFTALKIALLFFFSSL
jgi:hypothetical protein